MKCRCWTRGPRGTESLRNYSTARHHGDFDDDEATVKATLARMLGGEAVRGGFDFKRTKSSLRMKREYLSTR